MTAPSAPSAAPACAYTTYIQSTPEAVWRALTDEEATAAYWGHANVSDWQPGSPWEHRRTDGSGIADVVGTVVAATPPRRLVSTWSDPGDERPETTSQVTLEITPHSGGVRLTVTHEHLRDEEESRKAAEGWSMVLSNLKTYLETGRPMAVPPWAGHQS
ncbi:SRPBCC family protein [Streptomyces venezuelae]|uniref:SRPBCC family protein n=1 Tax=Streptomyces venezuelae TaxID=54571 RepID=UPI0029584A15|nr:SRPBCC family protein [Streptomyces venezuelae]